MLNVSGPTSFAHTGVHTLSDREIHIPVVVNTDPGARVPGVTSHLHDSLARGA